MKYKYLLIKKVLLTSSLLVFIFSLSGAQTIGLLWGMTNAGGDSSGGVLFNYDVLTSKGSPVHSFPIQEGIQPYNTELIQATDGNFYGMTEAGGPNNYGTIFKCGPSYKVTTLITFNNTNGANPYGGLIQATDGNLYGMTYNGGASNYGTIFKYNITSGVLTTLVSFTSTNGANPYGSLMQASDGNFYGMTCKGGTSNDGTIFKCTKTGTLTVLVNFNGTNGANPFGNLIQATDGNLYGMSYYGGSITDGTIFKCTLSGTLTNILFFNSSSSERPMGSLIQGTDGNLYGMTYEGGTNNTGTVFKCTTSGALTNLYSFPNNAYPRGSLIQASDGNLYGMTSGAGTSGYGFLFKCTTSGTLTTLVNFNNKNGATPYGSLMQASDGNLYGMTYAGGTVGDGTLFKCSTSGALSVVFNFGSTYIGTTPYGNVIQASDGNLYGMTFAGGLYNKGTIFKYTASGIITTLVNFSDTSGSNPRGSLIQAADGNLYGMTSSGGPKGDGTIFKCTTSGILDTLASFAGIANGAGPDGNLIQANDGNLYGMTRGGGSKNIGVIFKCTTSGTLTTIFNFDQTHGAGPYGSLIQASDSNLYGMTNTGGAGNSGIIFKCTTSGTLTDVFDFNGSEYPWWGGDAPLGSLVQASNGLIYGMTVSGGTSGDGNILEYGHPGSLLYSYSFSVNYAPQGSLVEASDGNLYGMTTGASINNGLIIKYGLDSAFAGVFNFTSNPKMGTNPYGDILEALSTIIIDSACTGSSSTLTASVRGGKSPFTYLWSTGATTSSIQGITTTGSYSVTVKDIRGITVSNIFNFLSVSTDSTSAICMGDSIHLSASSNGGTGSITYNWMPGSASGASPGVKPIVSTTYTVTATDKNGCTCTATQIVTVNPLPKIGFIGKTSICSGSFDTLIVSGGISYIWNTGATKDTIIVSPLTTATYSVSVSNGFCARDTMVKVTVNTTPTITVTPFSPSICSGSGLNLNATGAVSYTWAPSAGLSATTGLMVNASPATTTKYTVTGLSSAGCANTRADTITVYPSNGFDLTGSLTACIDTPGFSNASIQACIYNSRCMPVKGTLKLLLDTAFHITSTVSDSITRVNGDTLMWNYDSLSDIGKTHCVNLTGNISSLPAGDSVFVSMFISPVTGDSVPSNNSVIYWVKAAPYNCVGLPFDPNEKAVYPVGDISSAQKLTYTIHFQNTGNTIARNVVVIDTLSSKLDPTTLKALSSSSPMTMQVVSGHIVKFIFDKIDLPDTIMSKTTSIGVFTFSINPMGSDLPGDKITNNANIYFDANLPVKTNTTLNTIKSIITGVQNFESVPHIACFPNPFVTTTSIVFNTDGKHYIELDDMTGRKIETIECTGRQYELKRDNLASGIYFIRGYDEGFNYIATSKIVVQ